jgi:hypothetical protein
MIRRKGPRSHLISREARLTHVAVSSLFTDQNLNVITKEGHADPDVWAIGDAANIKGQLHPATAQGLSAHDPIWRPWAAGFSF